MKILFLVIVTFTTGCNVVPYLRRETVSDTQCREIQIGKYNQSIQGPTLWAASGCGRQWVCNRRVIGDYTRVSCKETPDSVQRTHSRILINRVSIISGCSAPEIKVERSSDWTIGTEFFYRLSTCKDDYVCSVSSRDGVNCQPTPK